RRSSNSRGRRSRAEEASCFEFRLSRPDLPDEHVRPQVRGSHRCQGIWTGRASQGCKAVARPYTELAADRFGVDDTCCGIGDSAWRIDSKFSWLIPGVIRPSLRASWMLCERPTLCRFRFVTSLGNSMM